MINRPLGPAMTGLLIDLLIQLKGQLPHCVLRLLHLLHQLINPSLGISNVHPYHGHLLLKLTDSFIKRIGSPWIAQLPHQIEASPLESIQVGGILNEPLVDHFAFFLDILHQVHQHSVKLPLSGLHLPYLKSLVSIQKQILDAAGDTLHSTPRMQGIKQLVMAVPLNHHYSG